MSVKWGRVVAPVVAILIAAVSVTLALVSENVSDRQERQLIKERSNELASVLSLSISDVRSMLQTAGNAALNPRHAGEFEAITGLATVQAGTSIVVARGSDTTYEVVASAGSNAPKTGTAVGATAAEVLARAPGAKGDMVSGVVTIAGAKRAIIAVAVTGETNAVAYYDSALTSTPAPGDTSSPFHELNVAVYAGTIAERGQLVMVSGEVPDAGAPVVEKQFKVGVDTWTMQISARSPLVGSLSTAFPYVVGGAGLAMALFMGLLIHVLMRRRAYALRLVEERTHLLSEAQVAAERANNAKSEFLSRMSHELRTPLNAVLGFAQLLELNGLTPEQAENVTQISRGGSHLLDLINEILDISQIETGRMSMSPESVLVSDVVDAAISLVGPLAIEKSVNLISSTEREPARYVFADRQRLKQILLNLLSNGIKYNRHGGSVSVNCFEPSPGLLRIQVTDTGPGIPAEKQHLLFVPFERLGAEDTLVEGTGVGLALSRGLATEMGGRLEVESTFGRGSTFWVELPIVESPLDRLEREDDTEPESRSGKQLVLHIEDNPANLALVERVLAQRPELALVPAMQGRRGLEIALRDRPALILLDLGLPDMTGAEVLKELRADPRTAGIPVVVISADAMPRQMQLLLSAGAAAYLTKPINIRDLLAQVDAAITGVPVEA
jgi:signal transduction histidine kinase/ActR/RegA family two-component response regulator